MQQLMPNPKDISDPTTAMNMALVLMAKAFKLNYSTPTNNNQRITSNPYNRQMDQPGVNICQDRQMQMVRSNGRLIVVSRIANQNPNRNGNVVAVQAEGDVIGNNADLDEIEEVNANCILMANLQQASTSGTQIDKAPVYDSDRSAEIAKIQTQFLKEAAKFIRDFKSLAKEANESLDKQGFGIGKQASLESSYNTVMTRRPQPRSNTKNDRVPSASKSSCSKIKEVEVKEHPRNLLLFKNKKHMSSECNNVKLAIQNDKSKVVYAMCK
uniref:Gag-Pol polyprotein n=1 Tax=Tanacetum cinerariifolium TaxID=118510 RepID=A0A699GWQ8_TANCI|nr:hypothetical protein [Tanacetum cinerariifolium]